MERKSKQVIVMIKDFIIDGKKVTPRKGKYCSQAAHASLAAILNQMEIDVDIKDDYQKRSLYLDSESALHDWINNSFTKITCFVNNEQELKEVYDKAKENGLLCSWIVDSGLTEFNGNPTVTCCAIGPAWSDELENITGHLALL